MRHFFKIFTLTIACLLTLLVVFNFNDRNQFNVSDVTSSVSFREDWEVSKTTDIDEMTLLSTLFDQPLTYLGEGGQSYAFASADGRYVMKFFKLNRFRPSILFQLLPNFPPFSSYIQSHTTKRHRKLETAFAGYKLAFDQHREESGLLIVRLNALKEPLQVTIKNLNGNSQLINLQSIPFIIQLKGEMLSETLQRELEKGDLKSGKETIDQLFSLFRLEHDKGLTDLDRGIMHNIGCVDGRLFHLDVGKLAYTEEIKKPEISHRELCLAATKVDSWIKKNFKEYSEPINNHLQAQFKEGLWPPVEKPKPSIKECENLFYSGLYSKYHQHLSTFIQQHHLYASIKEGTSPFDRQIQQLMAVIEKPLEVEPQEQRKLHENFIHQLRGIAENPELHENSEDNPSKQFFKELINWIYLEVDLKSDIEAYLSNYISVLKPEQQIYTYLTETQHSLHTTFKVHHHKNAKQSPEDQFLAGNLPLKLTPKSKANGPALIRIAQPLIGNSYLPYWLLPPVISPEFLQFLRQQPSHLYVNLMRRHHEEGSYSTALENLGGAIPNLYIVTLDKDSEFYWQIGPQFAAPLDSNEFKKIFYNKLTDPSGAFFWSARNLENDNWKTQLKKIISATHQQYFSNQATLSKAERQDFIELAYCGILNALVEIIRPTSMNVTCRQTMDRGPSMMTLWMIQQQQITNPEIVSMLLAPPLIVHRRTAHAPRIARLVSAAERVERAGS
ncbi:MAG: hypothetical protein H0U49_07350 [Parachlamydiaceae bacterium]|nr:hypothetical protein [Parachlamydiaceae bacterium]